jgi:hypothetical protein
VNAFTPLAALFGTNRIWVAPSSASSRAESSATAGNTVHDVPPLVEYCHCPRDPSKPVTAIPFGLPSTSLTWATRAPIGVPAITRLFGRTAGSPGSSGVKLVSSTGRSFSAVTSRVMVAATVPFDASFTRKVKDDRPAPLASGAGV